jgi:hypothetical protein
MMIVVIGHIRYEWNHPKWTPRKLISAMIFSTKKDLVHNPKEEGESVNSVS